MPGKPSHSSFLPSALRRSFPACPQHPRRASRGRERGVQGGAKLPPPTEGREAAEGRAFWSKEYCVLFVENKPTGTPECFEKTFRCGERGELRSPRPPKHRRPIRLKTSRSTPGGQREPMAPLCKGSCLPWQTEGLPCGENSENLAPPKSRKKRSSRLR